MLILGLHVFCVVAIQRPGSCPCTSCNVHQFSQVLCRVTRTSIDTDSRKFRQFRIGSTRQLRALQLLPTNSDAAIRKQAIWTMFTRVRRLLSREENQNTPIGRNNISQTLATIFEECPVASLRPRDGETEKQLA